MGTEGIAAVLVIDHRGSAPKPGEIRAETVRATEGQMVCVAATVDAALSAAIAVQQQVSSDPSPPAIGVTIGFVEATEPGPQSLAEGEALAAAAGPGRIFVSQAVVELDRHQFTTEDRGCVDHPWWDSGLACHEVHWRPRPAIAGHGVPAPQRSRPHVDIRPLPQVRELDRLRAAWRATEAGAPCAIDLCGEPGVGKTTLAREFATWVHGFGGIVVWGECSPESGPPYEPIAEGLGELLGSLRASARAELLGHEASDLARLLPHLGGDGSGEPRFLDPATSRYWMFRAVREVLRRITSHAPVLLVIDDAHWAGASTLSLLEFLRSEALEAPVCTLLVTRPTPIATAAATNAQSVDDSIELMPLGRRQAQLLVTRLAGHVLSAELQTLADRMWELTGGSPLLIGELWADLEGRGDLRRQGSQMTFSGNPALPGTPPSVQLRAKRLVTQLGASCLDHLQVAAAFGLQFELDPVADVVGADRSAVLSSLESAETVGLIGGVGTDRFRFRHELLARGLLDSMDAGSRRRLHERVAGSIERRDPEQITEICRHLTLAVPAVEAIDVVERAISGAVTLERSGRLEDAIETLDAVAGATKGSGVEHDVLFARTRMLTLIGDLAAATALVQPLAESAELEAHHDRAVASALAYVELVWRSNGRVTPPESLVDIAIRAAGERDRPLLLALQSAIQALSGLDERAYGTGRSAIAAAEHLDDPLVKSQVGHLALNAGWHRPDLLEHQLSDARTVTALARQAGSPELELRSLMKQHFALSALGRGDELAEVTADLSRLADIVRQPWLQAGSAAMRVIDAMSRGALDDAEEALGDFEKSADSHMDGVEGAGTLTFALRREQGRLTEFRRVIEVVARVSSAAWAPGLAALHVEVGLTEQASEVLDRIADLDDPLPPRDHIQLVSLSLMADAAAETGHRLCEVLYDALLPWSGRCIWAAGLACFGSADRYLGRLARHCRPRTVARRHLEAAVETDRAAGWPTWEARSRLALAEHLLELPSTHRLGEAQLETAERIARDHGLHGALQRVELLQSVGTSSQNLPQPLSPRELEILRLVAEGLTNREIGEQLHTSRHTVANQMRSILVKTGCANRAAAVAWAQQQQLLSKP